ncbi:MAG: recombinase family protein [Lachnospiraceae bacterium]|nr:recombinase family protein [Lachnospiraceae bacterium]
MIRNCNLSSMEYRVGMYIRLSKEDGDKEESSSVSNQRDMIHHYISEFPELIYVDEYVDDGYSGTNFDRPGFQRMIADIEKGKINTVITKDLSRLGRDYIDTGYYVQKYFPNMGVRYIAILDNVDSKIDDGMNELAPFKAVMNDMYCRDGSKKIRSVFYQKKKNGEFIGSTPPYGYRKDANDRHHLVVDEEEAVIVRRIYEMALRGYSFGKIARTLTNENIPVPSATRNNVKKTGKRIICWKERTIADILCNQVYLGTMIQSKYRKLNYKSKKKIRTNPEEWIIVENCHEAIIAKEQFDMVQKLNKNPAFFKYGDKPTHNYLLKGLLKCAECGAPLQVVYSDSVLKNHGEYRLRTVCYSRQKNKKLCTTHSNYIKDIEAAVLEDVRHVCTKYLQEMNPEAFYELAKKEETLKSTYDKKQVKKLEEEANNIKRYLQKIYKDKITEVISEDDYLTMQAEFQSELDEVQKKKQAIEEKIAQKKGTLENDELKALVEDFVTLKEPTPLLLHQLIEKITIDESKNITIFYAFQELKGLSDEEAVAE